MNTLPDKPSELIRVAIKDLEAVEKDSRYCVYMGEWHAPFTNKPCHVCLAGAVMAKSLDADVSMYLDPGNFDLKTHAKLTALNYFRIGYVRTGLSLMKIYNDDVPNVMYMTHYEEDPEAFKDQVSNLADILESHDL